MMGVETYNGLVRTPTDARIIFEACNIGLLRRVQRRLSEKERQSIKSGSVFVWDEREAGVRRWTDGKSWSASRVSGSFLTYREMEGKRVSSSVEKNANRDGVQDGQQQTDVDEGPDGYKCKPNGLMKQSISITTENGQDLHLISYFSQASPNAQNLMQPSSGPQLKRITPEKGMYPESIVHEQRTIRAVTQKQKASPGYTHQLHQQSYTRRGVRTAFWLASKSYAYPTNSSRIYSILPYAWSRLWAFAYHPLDGQNPPMTAFDWPPPPMSNSLPLPPLQGQYRQLPQNGYHNGHQYPANPCYSHQPLPLQTPQSQPRALQAYSLPAQQPQQPQRTPPLQQQAQPYTPSASPTSADASQQNGDTKRQDFYQLAAASAGDQRAEAEAPSSSPAQTGASGTKIPSISAMLNDSEGGQTAPKTGDRSSTSPRLSQDILMHELDFEANHDVQVLRILDKRPFRY
ncbi:hypothetical protein D0866_11784 [Hortaea werneckii]|uniref:cAMP-independent regulatory protein pac2 n=1 Tax=Hortaea werneckii TaxID=91943 RepID=A0A3M7A6E2_HORWE|nr:hypothetical protein D0866_11784 [Hortaea werneckii]